MKKETITRLFRFGVIGSSGFLVDFGFYYFLSRVFGLGEIQSNLISVAAAIVWNFIGNKFWVFKSAEMKDLPKQGLKFAIISGISYVIQQTIFILLLKYQVFGQFNQYQDFAAKIVAIFIATFNNYFANRHWTFRK